MRGNSKLSLLREQAVLITGLLKGPGYLRFEDCQCSRMTSGGKAALQKHMR